MVDVDTKLFRSFLAVATERSFSVGARRMGYSQATMSLRVRALEGKLGVRLLDRGPRDVKLTAAGRGLLPEIRALLDMHDRMVERLMSAPLASTIRLGVAEGYVASLLPGLLQDMLKNRSGVQLDILCRTSGCLQRMIEARELDLAVVTLPEDAPYALDLCRPQLQWVSSSNFALDLQAPVPVAWYGEGCDFRASGAAALKNARIDYREVLLGSDERIVQAAVVAGCAVTVMASGNVPTTLKVVSPQSGLPPLGRASIQLLELPGAQSEAVEAVKRKIVGAYRRIERGQPDGRAPAVTSRPTTNPSV